MNILFSPNHVQLVTACYPSSAALLTAGPDYKPNAQELSRLTYYAANRPGKINKLAGELEKRTKAECRKAQAGNTKYRASLLITLAIFRALATECRNDITLLSASLVSAVNATLLSMSSDLEVTTRAASLFTSWTTYTDGHLIGVDGSLTQNYLSSLKEFGRLSAFDAKDQELRNQTRLLGFAALTGVISSEALFNATSHFKPQVSTIVDAMLANIMQVKVQELEHAAMKITDNPNVPYLAESRSRPNNERRAVSIHAHVDGESGPSTADVIQACLQALSSAFDQANGAQVGHLMQAIFESLDSMKAWNKSGHCCWLAQKAADWAQYQYRYAVPTQLVERLLEVQDKTTSTTPQRTLCAMVTAVFTSPTPLVNLSTSDIVSNLVALILRRVTADPDDQLLLDLVQCISALGSHVYYADQIQDLASELISRLQTVEANGVLGRAKSEGLKHRTEALRALLAGLVGLMQVADKHDGPTLLSPTNDPPKSPLESTRSQRESFDKHTQAQAKPSRRTHISPEIWQDTLTLLCDGDFAVRADYMDALTFYLSDELEHQSEATDAHGIKRPRPLADGPVQQATNMTAALHGDSATRLLSAAHAYIYILATSSALGLNYSSSSPTPSTLGDSARSTNGAADGATSQSSGQAHNRRRSVNAPSTNSRKVSVAQRYLDALPERTSLSSCSATSSDYAYILQVLAAIHRKLPVRGLLTGMPMLVALNAAATTDETSDAVTVQRARAIRRIIAQICDVIGQVWACQELQDLSQQALASMPTHPQLPELTARDRGTLQPIPQCVKFSGVDARLEDGAPGVDLEVALVALAANRNVQDAIGLDQQSALRRLARHWTAETAIGESTEQNLNTIRVDGMPPLLKISPALMHIENLSLASLSRPTKGVGIQDLREALEGRSSVSLAQRAPSISTLDHTSAHGAEPASLALTLTRSRTSRTPKKSPLKGPTEVRDVLNKLGIGKQSAGGILKTPFTPSSDGRDKVRTGTVVPPYRS